MASTVAGSAVQHGEEQDQTTRSFDMSYSRELLRREALLLSAADITQTTVAAWQKSSAGGRGSCVTMSSSASLPDYASLSHLQGSLFSDALAVLSKSHIWKDSQLHYRTQFRSELLRYIDKKNNWDKLDSGVHIEVRSHSKPEILENESKTGLLDKNKQPLETDKVVETLLANMSSSFSIATYLPQEKEQDTKRYEAMFATNLQTFESSFRKFDTVAISFTHPDFPNDPSKKIRSGGILYDINHSKHTFKIAMAGFFVDEKSSNEDSGFNRKTSWFNASQEERERFLPVKSPLYKEDSEGRRTPEKFISKTSGKEILSHVKGKMVKLGSISEALYSCCMMSKIRKSVGSYFTSGNLPIYQPRILEDVIEKVQDVIFNQSPLARLTIESTSRTRFASDFCKLATGEQCLSWAWGLAGSGKTAWLVALITSLTYFHLFARTSYPDAEDDDDMPLHVSPYHIINLRLVGNARVFALSDTNQATSSFARRIFYNNEAMGVSNSLLCHFTTVDEISPLTRDFNVYTKIWRIYHQVIPFVLGNLIRKTITTKEKIQEGAAELKELEDMRRKYAAHKQQGYPPDGLEDVPYSVIDSKRSALIDLKIKLAQTETDIDLMKKAQVASLEDLISDVRFRPLLERAFKFKLHSDSLCGSIKTPVTNFTKYGYVPKDSLRTPEWEGAQVHEIQDSIIVPTARGDKEVLTPCQTDIALWRLKYLQCHFVVCTTGYFMSRLQKIIGDEDTIILNDEVGRQHRWITAAVASCTSNLISAGDHKQLGPYHTYLEESLPERSKGRTAKSVLWDLGTKELERAQHGQSMDWTILCATKRMHPILAAASSSAFYDDRLTHHPDTAVIRRGLATAQSGAGCPIVILDVVARCSTWQPPRDPSTYNIDESKVAFLWAMELHTFELAALERKSSGSVSDFFALSLYKAQVDMLTRVAVAADTILTRPVPFAGAAQDQIGRGDIGRLSFLWNTSTIARSQGLEKSYALVSLAKSSYKQDGTETKEQGMLDAQILTTGITRGMRGTVLIGDMSFHAGFENYAGPVKRLLSFATRPDVASYYKIERLEDIHEIWDAVWEAHGYPRVRPEVHPAFYRI